MAARSTFREVSADVAWQRQLRDRYAAEGVPPVPHLDLKRAVVRPVSRRTAEQIILKYEWLGTMAKTSLHFGLFFGPYCAGVTCVGIGATAGAQNHMQYGIERSTYLTLARGACVHWAPPGTNSKLVAWTCRLLAGGGRWKLIAAYADSDAGEIGTIYQAANWPYVGVTSRGGFPELIAPNGRVYNGRIVGTAASARGIQWRRQKEAMFSAGWQWQPSNPKHRYVCVLDRSDTALVDRIERMRQPYPKRAKQSSDAPAVQVGEGGAAPTGTLQDAR